MSTAVVSPGRRMLAGVVLGVLVLSLLVVRTSSATFTDTTAGAGSWTAGTVLLGAEDVATLTFDGELIVPGYREARCVEVTYDGNVDADVVFYVRGADLDTPFAAGAPLAAALRVIVDRGTVAAANCDVGLPAGSFSRLVGWEVLGARFANLAGLQSWAAGAPASGGGGWTNAPQPGAWRASPDDHRVYRIDVFFDPDALPDTSYPGLGFSDLNGEELAVTFVWEARSIAP